MNIASWKDYLRNQAQIFLLSEIHNFVSIFRTYSFVAPSEYQVLFAAYINEAKHKQWNLPILLLLHSSEARMYTNLDWATCGKCLKPKYFQILVFDFHLASLQNFSGAWQAQTAFVLTNKMNWANVLRNKINLADYWQPKLTRMLKWHNYKSTKARMVIVNRPKYVHMVSEWQVHTFIINDKTCEIKSCVRVCILRTAFMRLWMSCMFTNLFKQKGQKENHLES